MVDIEAKRSRQREAQRRYRERLRAAGLPTSSPRTESQKNHQREYMQQKRADARARGELTASETWWARNRERHRENTRKWRAENIERARELTRNSQATRRSTPWGMINNRIWTVMHGGVRRNSYRESKYTKALGYPWGALRLHLEVRFLPGMTWDNWGEAWELDHIRPLSEFHYTSLDDPLFHEAWQLGNLRPLWKADNQAKGNRTS